MIKIRTKGHTSNVHKCHKQSCQGAQNILENYLTTTSRNASPYPSKNKTKKSKSSKNLKKKSNQKHSKSNNHSNHPAVHQLLQQSYMRIKQENQDLHKKLNHKKKKIQQLKDKLKSCEVRLAIVQRQNLSAQKQKHGKLISPQKSSINKKYGQIVTASQNLAKQTLQRYRVLEDQYMKYKQSAQKKINKLMKQKDQIIISSNKQDYNKTQRQVQNLRKQIKKLRQDQLTASSFKNLNTYNAYTQRNQKVQKYQKENNKLKEINQNIKLQNTRLQNHIDNLQNQLKTMSMISKGRQQQLKVNLDIISEKVSNWEMEYRKIQESSIQWQIRYNRLYEKYENRRKRQKNNNQEWASIFKQFISQIQKLKRQLQIVSQKNLKLIKFYGANQ